MALAAAGATVVAVDINEGTLGETVAAIEKSGRKAKGIRADLGSVPDIDRLVKEAMAAFGQIDILVNNAGISWGDEPETMPLEKWQKVIDVNLTGAFVSGQASARAMAKAGRGRIVNISSISGQQGGTGRVAYGASKAGIISLTQTMAVELGPLGITVNAIAPGPTQVSRLSHGPKQKNAFLSRMALKKYALPADIAAAAVFLVSDDASHITGHVLNVDGGFAAAGVLFDPDEEKR
jgi:3-oxoacyl-[acyl-carrier protein] reductase